MASRLNIAAKTLIGAIFTGIALAPFFNDASQPTKPYVTIPATGQQVRLQKLDRSPAVSEIPQGLDHLSIGSYRYLYHSSAEGAFMECNVTVNGNGQPALNGRLPPRENIKPPAPTVYCAPTTDFVP